MATDATVGRLMAWLNDPEDPLWERPRPGRRALRRDAVGAAIYLVVALALLAATHSLGMRIDQEQPVWRAYVAMVAIVAPLFVRRRFPVTVLVVSSALFFLLHWVSLDAYMSVPYQAAYFAALYAGVAWAQDRRLLWGVTAVVLLGMMLWIVINYTTISSIESLLGDELQPAGPLSQLAASVLYDAVVNIAYFGGALFVGRAVWRSALQRERLEVQARHISEQSAELARRAVVDERLRIARELHDVVAHHVAVIGIQAGAARRVLDKDHDAAAEALRTVETSSREAVGEMRSLLGVLRSDADDGEPADGAAPAAATRAPEPGLADLACLAEEYARSGIDVELRRTEDRPGDLAQVPAPHGLSAYRIVQESLANVARHSTANQVLVTLRTGRPSGSGRPPVSGGAGQTTPAWVEVEVVDNGRPRSGTTGSGFGLRGIRERVSLHGGEVEAGARLVGDGWRVRARLPLCSALAESAEVGPSAEAERSAAGA